MGARGDVQNFGGCQAPARPVLTQALKLFSRLIRWWPLKSFDFIIHASRRMRKSITKLNNQEKKVRKFKVHQFYT